MNNFYIRVIVASGPAIKGISAIAASLNGLQSKAERVASYFRTLFALDTTRRVVAGVFKMNDAYADLETKIQRASGKNDLLTISMDKTFKAANRSRMGVEAFGKTVLAMANATRTMNMGFDVSVRMAETLSKMLRLDGATASESRSVLLQYGQALRKGKLDGDEFRAVMENSSEVQKALAKSLGISTDELARYSKQGKITRQAMVDALIKEADRVDREFAHATMRIQDGFTVIENAAIRFFGELRLGEKVVPVLLWVADNFDTIAQAAMVAANVVGAYFVRKGIAVAIAGMAKLAVAMYANPFLTIIYGVTAAVAALRIFGKDVKVASDSMATWGDVFTIAWEKILSALGTAMDGIKAGISAMTDMFGEMVEAADISGQDVVIFFAAMGDAMIKIGYFIRDTVVTVFGGMGATIADGFTRMINLIIDAVNDLYARLQKTKMFVDNFGMAKGGYDKQITSRGYIIPPPADAPNSLSWVDPTKIPGYKIGSEQAFTDAQRSGAQPGVPGGAFRQVDKYGADYAKSLGFDKEVFDLAQQLGVTLNDAAFRLYQTGQTPADNIDRNAIPKLDNPYEGAFDVARKKADEDWEKLLSGEAGPIQKFMEELFDEADVEGRRKKRDRRRGLFEPGEPGDPQEDEKARKARERALKDYESLEASISGVYKAELELANAQETIDKARAYGVEISADRESYILARKQQLLMDQLEPYNALMRTMNEDIDKTRQLNGEWDISLRLLDERNKLWEKGEFITREQNDELERTIRLQQGLSDDQKRKQQLLTGVGYVSPDEQKAYLLAQASMSATDDEDYNRRAATINATSFQPTAVNNNTAEGRAKAYHKSLVDIVRIGQEWKAQGYEQNAILEVQNAMLAQLNEQFGVLNQRQLSVTQGLKDGWKQAFDDFGNTAGQVAGLVSSAFGQMSDAIVDFVMTGKFGWQDLVTSILKGMAQIATQRLFWELMNLVGGPPGVGGAVRTIGDGLIEPTFAADGGLFRVHGPSGRDKVPAPMMLSDGEHVRVYPRGVDPNASVRQVQPAGPNVIVVQNTESAMLAVLQSPSNRRTTIQHVAVNEAYLRTMQRRS